MSKDCQKAKKMDRFLDLCVSSLRRGHANLLCIVPNFVNVFRVSPRTKVSLIVLIYIPYAREKSAVRGPSDMMPLSFGHDESAVSIVCINEIPASTYPCSFALGKNVRARVEPIIGMSGHEGFCRYEGKLGRCIKFSFFMAISMLSGRLCPSEGKTADTELGCC